MSSNHFVELASIDVSKYVEKKQNLSYLSWAWAVDQLLRRDPTANWHYGEPVRFGDTMMVSCGVMAFGKVMTCHLPVMDHRNKAISNPDAFQVNTAMQRCLVKAIALHGLGLYIYAGEDVPRSESDEVVGRIKGAKVNPSEEAKDAFESLPEDAQNIVREWAMQVVAYMHDGTVTKEERIDRAARYVMEITKDGSDQEGLLALSSQLDSQYRNPVKERMLAIRRDRHAAEVGAALTSSKAALKKVASRPTPGELSTQA